jgi:hypothetical protein
VIDLSFSFTGKCWLWQGKGAWYFITLPLDKSEEIKFFSVNNSAKRRGWGAVRVIASIGNTDWETSIFPYKKQQAYILPLKAEIRKKEQIIQNSDVTVKLKIYV